MLISELSRRTGVPSHRLRYYEAQGLLRPRRSENGYRHYDTDAEQQVRDIAKLLEIGLATKDIQVLLPCMQGAEPELAACTEMLDAMRGRLDMLDERIDTLTRSRKGLRHYIDNTEREMRELGLAATP